MNTFSKSNAAGKALRVSAWSAALVLLAVLPLNADAAGNKKPKAIPGPAQTVNEQTPVTLNGSASSDADGTIASYLWQQTSGTPVTLSGANSSQASFTSPLLKKAAKLGFKLTVTDNLGATASKAVKVTVKPVNTAPVANAGSEQNVLLGAAVTLNAGGSSDSDGQIVKYLWKQTKGKKVKLSSSSVVAPSFTAPAAAEQLSFTVAVTDDEKATTVSLPVNINVAATVPAALSASLDLDKTTLTKNATLTATAHASGGKAGYSYSIDWGDGSALASSANATHSYAALGSYTVTLTVTDADNKTKTATQIVTVAADPLTAKFDPVGSTPTIIAGDTLTFKASEIAGGIGPYKVTFDWGDSTVQEFALDAGIVSKAASHPYNTVGSYQLTITVTDTANVTKSYSITVDVQAADPLGQC